MTKDELISILELRFNEQTHALGHKMVLERMKEIDEYLRCFGYSIELGYFGKSVYISRNQGKTVCLEELKERLI